MVFKQRDVRLPLNLFGERELHGVAGRIFDMQNAPMAVAAFAREVKAERAGFVARERHTARDQPFDGVFRMLHDEARRGFVI